MALSQGLPQALREVATIPPKSDRTEIGPMALCEVVSDRDGSARVSRGRRGWRPFFRPIYRRQTGVATESLTTLKESLEYTEHNM